MVKVVHAQVRLRVVQPKGVDAQIEVVLFAGFPHIGPGLRVENIDFHAVALEVVGLGRAPLGAHQQPLLHHGPEIFRFPVHRGPHRDDHFGAHGVELLDHSLGVGPVFPVKFPVSLKGPVEEVNDHLVNVDALGLIPAGHFQHLVLGAVAELALPQPHAVLGEERGASGGGGVVLEDLLGGIRRCNPIVHLLGGAGLPLIVVVAEGDLAHSGIVPQKSVAQGGQGKGHGDLGVALGQLQHTALHVHALLLVLTHTKDFFLFVALKLHQKGVLGASNHTLPLPVNGLEAAALPGDGSVIGPEIFPQKQGVVPVEGDNASVVHLRPDAAIDNGAGLTGGFVLAREVFRLLLHHNVRIVFHRLG